MDLSNPPQLESLLSRFARFWELSAEKIRLVDRAFDRSKGAPVYTVQGRYTTRGWTEWTQGFQVGSHLLQFDATGDVEFLDTGRVAARALMAPHITHFGVHDHGFQIVSTFGSLRRLMGEGRIPDDKWERAFYESALQTSGIVQARRWTPLADGGGFIHSFNGPHSLFSDTIRSLRSLALAHRLGGRLKIENKQSISLLERLIDHARTTARYNVFYGEGRDGYDVRGRVAHESLFNTLDGSYRCPSTQQGYSPFSTWTRGLAWILCGYAEQLEFLEVLTDHELEPLGGRAEIEGWMRRAAEATADYYIASTPACGVPYWDTGAPGLDRLGDYLARPADPFNDIEPVDSSAAAIAAQGLLRLGHYLEARNDSSGGRYRSAAFRIVDTLLDEPYLSTRQEHQGLLLHAVYHWPNRWDHVPAGRHVACGESCLWGDYHLREVILHMQRMATGAPYLTFFSSF